MRYTDAAWLAQIVAFMEFNYEHVYQLKCKEETSQGIDEALVEIGRIIGVGGHHNNRRNKRRNKRSNKRSNNRINKRCNKRSIKRRKWQIQLTK